MSAKIGSLLIDIHANVAQLQKDFAKAQGILDGALGKMSGTLKAFAGAAATYFAADKLLGFVDRAIDGADALGKMSARTGASVEALSALQHAANLSDASIEDVGKSLAMLAQKAVDAANGSSEAARSFAQLGIEFQNSDGSIRASDKLLLDLADRMKALPDGAAKSGLAMKLLGEAGTKLIPLLNNGRDGLEALRREAEDFGLVIDGVAAKQAEAFNDNLTRLSNVASGLANVVVERLLPDLLRFTDWLVENGKHAREFGEIASTGFKLVATVGLVLWRVVEDLGRGFGALAAMIVEFFRGNFREASAISEMAAEDSRANWSKTFEDIGKLWEDSPEKPKAAVDETRRAVQVIPRELKKVAEEAEKSAARIASSLRRTATLEASLTTTRSDDIRASYAAQIADLETKIADEKTKEAEKTAHLAELDALRRKEARELRDAEVEEHRAAERRKLDVEHETAAARAQLTDTAIDDIRADYAQRLDLLRRRLEDEGLTEAEYAEQRALLLAEQERRITETQRTEMEERNEGQRRAMEQVAGHFANAWADLVFAPLESGFKSVEDVLKNLGSMVLSLAKQLVASGIMKLILGGATGGVGGGLLSLLGLADGGFVRGPGGPREDRIPAMLSNGEFVLNARATERLGLPFLNFLNGLGHRPATRIPAFAAGGPVSTAGARAGGRGGPAASVQLSPTFVVQAGGGLLHRELLVRELGPAMRQMAIEQMDGIIRQLGLNPAAVTARG